MYAMFDIKFNIIFVDFVVFRYVFNLINIYHFIIKRISRYLRFIS